MNPDARSSETVHRVPRSHWDCHLHTYRWDWLENGERVRAAVDAFVTGLATRQAPHLLLLGERGLGKTHLAVGIYRAAVYELDLSRAALVHVPSFCDEVKAGFNDRDAPDPFDDLRRADVAVIDDLFGRMLTEWEITQVVPRLIDEPYRRRAAMVVTANPSLDEIRATLDPHEVSRLLERATVVNMRGQDRRLRC